MIATPVAILIKCLVVTNEWTYEVLPIDVQSGICASRVIDALSGLVRRHGAPRHCGRIMVPVSVTVLKRSASRRR